MVVVTYNNADSLQFALRGIDTVVSTVTGPNQIQLIKAAVASKARRFAPAEFEGQPHRRPVNDPLDRSRTNALDWLRHFQGSIEYTVFVCGIFYERFQPGGLPRALIARKTGYHAEGSYILDCANMSAELPVYGTSSQPDVKICMTAIKDVARFVTKAIDLATWPAELRMCGDRMTVQNLASLVEQLKSRSSSLDLEKRLVADQVLPEAKFEPCVTHNLSALRAELLASAGRHDWARGMRLRALMATAEGGYDFSQFNLNTTFPGLQPERFASWFSKKWELDKGTK